MKVQRDTTRAYHHSCLKRSHGPIDKKARARRKNGGKLAIGRDSGTRASLTAEREYVKARYGGWCEAHRFQGGTVYGCGGTDFAHVIARSQGGEDTRFNALWLCRDCHTAMAGPFARGRLLVTRVMKLGVRGFDVEWVKAAGKVSYRLGEYQTLGHGFVAAEKR